MLKNLSCVAALLPTMREENVVALLLQVMHFTSAPHAGGRWPTQAKEVSSPYRSFTVCLGTSFTVFGSELSSGSHRSTAVERWLSRSSSRTKVRQ